MNTTKKKEVK
jgi:hypothetical protein